MAEACISDPSQAWGLLILLLGTPFLLSYGWLRTEDGCKVDQAGKGTGLEFLVS